MTVKLSKDAIDIGIVTNNLEATLRFYRDLLGFAEQTRLPFTYGGTVYKLACGETVIKIVAPTEAVDKVPEKGLMAAATGFRYVTIWVKNLAEIMNACVEADVKVLEPYLEPRPGVAVGIVADPDGNVVEFAQID